MELAEERPYKAASDRIRSSKRISYTPEIMLFTYPKQKKDACAKIKNL